MIHKKQCERSRASRKKRCKTPGKVKEKSVNSRMKREGANFKSIGSLVLITCFFVRQNRFGALIQTFSQKTAKNQISGRFPPLPSTRDVLDILLFTSA